MRRASHLFIIAAVSIVCLGFLLIFADMLFTSADSNLAGIGEEFLYLGAACGFLSMLLAWLAEFR